MGAQNIGNLKVSIGGDTKDLARGIGRAKDMMRSLSRAAKVSGKAAAAAFAAASIGVIAMTKGGLAAVDAQAKLARSVDGSIDGIRALQLAGRDAGVDLDLVSDSAREFGKALAEAAAMGTGPAAEALARIGLNAEKLMALDIDERFAVMADRIEEMGMSAQDAAFLMNEFGVSNIQAVALLTQGSAAIRAARGEVRKFGLSMSSEVAGGIESANVAMSRIGYVFEGLRNQLAVAIAPTLERLAIGLRDASAAGGPLQASFTTLVQSVTGLASALLDPAFVESAILFGTTIANAVAGLSRFLVVLGENAEIAGVAMVGLGAAMVFFSGPIGLAIAAIAGGVFLLSTRLGENKIAADAAAEAERQLLAALQGIDTANSDAAASGRELIGTHISQARAAITAAQAEYELARAETSRAVDQAKMRAQTGTNFFASDEISQAEDDAAFLDDHYGALIDKRQAQLEKYQKILQGFEMSRFDSRGQRDGETQTETPGSDPLGIQKLSADLEKLIATIDPTIARSKQLAAAMQLLTQAKKEGVITDDEFILRAEQINRLYGEMPELTASAAAGVRAVKSEMEKAAETGTTMADDISGAFENLIRRIDGGKDALKDFAIEIIKMLAIRGISTILGGSDWLTGSLFSAASPVASFASSALKAPSFAAAPMGAQMISGAALGAPTSAMQFTYSPTIDARGASLQAVQELDTRMRADAAQFNAKVETAVRKARSGRKM